MRISKSLIAPLAFALLVSFSTDATAGRLARPFGSKAKSEKANGPAKKGKDKLKSFKSMIKDKIEIEGLFTFYHDTIDNSMLMAILPEQMGPIYLCSETRSRAEGAFFDNGSQGRDFPFYFKRIGKRIQFMEKNLRFRADSTSAMRRAIEHGISDHLFASTAVKSKPQDSTKAILVNPADFFVRDAQNIGYFVGQRGKTGISFDSKNSYFDLVKSFPENTEIDVRLHYKTSKPFTATTMQNPYSLFHTFHYSLSSIPETDYVPRIADDRVGHFLTLYEDYTDLSEETPYVRYVQRWNLKKKNPDARISEPVEPIVFWVENTVPEDYRDAVAEGIEFWNGSFEKIGFRNAVVAKQMPDDAEWDPADVRYNTVRWILIPGGGYAVGPSRANPFTGQIYDADVRVSSDFVRYMFNNMEYFIKPLSFDGKAEEDNPLLSPLSEEQINSGRFCQYGAESAKEAAFGLAYLTSSIANTKEKDALTKEYVHSYIVELIAHEIGHTLGFRHNFKASSIYGLDQIQDPEFTRKYSTGGTVMDYTPPNISAAGQEQGEFYASVPGPYDDWVVEYAYSEFGGESPFDELPQLRKIAARSSDHRLVYGTDEDAFGYSPKSIDPTCNLFDHGDDPMAYDAHKIALTNELWRNSLAKFERKGEGYQKVLRAFGAGWRSYYETAFHTSKYVGGIYHHRNHVGQSNGRLPFEPVAAADQRKAIDFLSDKLFAPNAFDLPSDIINKLQPERFPDFNWSVYSMRQIDYPLHQTVLGIQNLALSNLYSPYVLGRLLNNLERFAPGQEKYTMHDMFRQVRRAIWTEAVKPENVNSFRRQLQLSHLNRIAGIYLSRSAVYPSDSRTLAANDLSIIENLVRKASKSSTIGEMTRAHYNEVLRQIEAARGAKRSYARR
ncbi:MAG: zinc-dependent metalloprotease [Candidatus Zixiibacteriota bacterium]